MIPFLGSLTIVPIMLFNLIQTLDKLLSIEFITSSKLMTVSFLLYSNTILSFCKSQPFPQSAMHSSSHVGFSKTSERLLQNLFDSHCVIACLILQKNEPMSFRKILPNW